MVICTSGNAVVVSDDGKMIKYRKKCPQCGVLDSQESLCSILSGRVSNHYSACCGRCGRPWGSFDFERR